MQLGCQVCAQIVLYCVTMFVPLNIVYYKLCLQAMDAIKKLYSSLPKDDIKRLEKEVSFNHIPGECPTRSHRFNSLT